MKTLNINDNCIGCGFCFGEAPELFTQNDDGLASAIVNEISDDAAEQATEIASRCPVNAIEVKDKE